MSDEDPIQAEGLDEENQARMRRTVPVTEQGEQLLAVLLRQGREAFPDKSKEWLNVWVLRLIHYSLHQGDMTNAPEFP